MPPLPSVPQVIFAKFGYFFGLDQGGWGVHFKYTGGAPQNSDLTTAAAALAAAWSGIWAAHTHPQTVLRAISLQDLTSPASAFGVWDGSHPGTAAGIALPGSTPVLVNHNIQRRYRGGKPKCFIPAGTASDLNNAQEWTGLAVTNFQTAFDAWKGQLASTSYGPAVFSNLVAVSYYQGFTAVENPVTGRWRNVPKLRAGGPLVDVVTSSVVNPRLGAQRRRLFI
jgi:hypothetical protein